MKLREQERIGKTCQWFDMQEDPREDEQTLCGAPAMHRVKVIGGVTSALVFLCEDHKTHVNEQMAARRVEQDKKKMARTIASGAQLAASSETDLRAAQALAARLHETG